MSDQGGNSLVKLPKRRWRLAFAAIFFTRALVSVNKKLVLDKKQISPDPSSVTIDIREKSDDLLASLCVDHRLLTEQLTKEKNPQTLSQLGRVKQIAIYLKSNEKDGISGNDADLAARIAVFGANKYPRATSKSFLSFFSEAFKDNTMIILLVCGLISLVLRIKRHGLKDVPYDGVSTIFIVFPLAFVSALRNFHLNRKFQKLLDDSTMRVQVVRDGQHRFISKLEVVVGDIVSLKTGDEIPADGLLLDGNFLQVNEYGVAGERNLGEIKNSNDPFLLSGTKVLDGYGSMLVTSVGVNTAWGEMMSSVQHDLDEPTPLQARLSKMNSFVQKVNLAVAFLLHVVLLIRYFTGNTKDDKGNKEFMGETKLDSMMNSVVDIISAAITIVVVATPEGLPLALTLALACSLKLMMADHAMVRKLSACEMMGSTTTICTDKTGTLTLNEMKVTEFWLGRNSMKHDNSLEIAPIVYELLQQGVGLNTSGTVNKRSSGSVPEISGSPTEQAIFFWAVLDLGMNLDDLKQDNEIIQVEAFNSKNKRSGVLIRRNDERATHTHWKGAAEIIQDMCSEYYERSGKIIAIDDEERIQLGKIVQKLAAEGLRCIAFAHTKTPEDKVQVSEKLKESGLTLLGLVGLNDPCRPGVRRAIECCRNAGLNVKIITGDNVFTAKAIAIESGILESDEDLIDAVIEGEQFRNYSPDEKMEKINKIRVMARSSPTDKLLMVQCLKHSGHVVAVIGDGINDVPALKEAHIGLSMGTQGTEIAKESSDIVIMDDNFTSVVAGLRWGRCVHNNIQKFIQFQLTVNLSALTINFVASIFCGKFPLTPLQLLWVSLITDTFGAFALASERPTDDLLTKPPNPVGQSKALISKVMWRNLISQALYQVAIVLTLYFRGTSIFGVDDKVKNTLVFNTFVLCQIFNEFNVRKLEKKNVFNGLQKNKPFIGILGLTLLLQAVMVELPNKLFQIQRLDLGQWGACIAAAALSLPNSLLFKWIHCQMTKIICREVIQFSL